jgi:hypothetical protein
MPKIIFKPEIEAVELTELEINAALGVICTKKRAPKIIAKGKLPNACNTVFKLSIADLGRAKSAPELYNKVVEALNLLQENMPILGGRKLEFNKSYTAIEAFVRDHESDTSFQNRVAEAVEYDKKLEQLAIYQAKRKKYEDVQKKLATARQYKAWLKENRLLDV